MLARLHRLRMAPRALEVERGVGIALPLAGPAALDALRLAGAAHDLPRVPGHGGHLAVHRRAERVVVPDRVSVLEGLDEDAVALAGVALDFRELGGGTGLLLDPHDLAAGCGAVDLVDAVGMVGLAGHRHRADGLHHGTLPGALHGR